MPETNQDTTIYSTLADDPDFSELVEMYVDEMADRIATLEQSYESSNREELRRTAHQMKGAAGSYGFDKLTNLAATLEYSVRDDEPEEKVLQALHTLIGACRQVRAGVPE